jgi:iron complex outermembrane receptor protein
LKTYLLQSAAIAALACTMAQTARADEPAPVDAAAVSNQLDKIVVTRPIVVAQATAPTAPTIVAQVAPPAVVVQAGAAAPAAAPRAMALDTAPEQIVVTATRRETFLQDTPIAISAVSTDELDKRHVESLIDLANGQLPYLRVATFEARQSALTVGIRGIVPFDANQTARDQGVGIYLDGVYLGRQQGLNTALLDIERIEVLRGPQGTLFGRNTEGGAVSLITKAPSGVFGLRVEGGIGNYGAYESAFHLDLPKYANFSVKVDALIDHQDATVSNPLAGQTGWNYFNRYGGRVAARWTPVAGFTADFAFDTGVDQNTPFYSQLVNYNANHKTVGVYDLTTNRLVAPGSSAGAPTCGTCIAPLSPLVQVHADDRQKVAEIGVPQQPSLDKTNGFTSTLSYEISDALALKSITAWRGVSTDQWDNSGGPHRTIYAPNANFSRYSLSMLQQHQFSQELQAVGSIPEFDYAVGLYYFNEHASEKAATPSTNKWNATGTGYTINSESVIPPITSGNQGWDPNSWFVQRSSRAEAESYSAFGQVTWTPASFDALHLTGGARYTHDKRDGVLFTVINQPTNFLFTFKDDRIDPMATVAYDVTQDVNVYFTYATGFRAGGANDRSQTFTAFGPESVKSYEIGAKTEWLDHRVRLNVAGYLMDRKNTQTDFDNVDTNPNSPTFNLHTEETRNASGTSNIRGVEADLTIRLTDELTVGASYAYTHVKIPPTPNPFLNNVLFPVVVVFTPPNAGSVFADYEMPLGSGGMSARFHLDANYGDATYSFQGEPTVKTQSSFIVNGRIALADIPLGSFQSMTLSVWSRNLFNETHIYRRSAANANVLGDYANFNPPRTFGIQGEVRF